MTNNAPGVYFGMSNEEYHADPALSVTGIKNLLVSPLDYWMESPLNPEAEPEEEEDHFIKGRAFHCFFGEGIDAFNAAYAVALDKADFPNALSGGDELRAECKRLGVSAGGTIAAMCERIHEADPCAELWPVMVENHKAANEGKEMLSRAAFKEMERTAKALDWHPDARKCLTGGYPEVAIFWIDEETGVRMKVKVDYLKAKAAIDLKTFGNPAKFPVDEAIARAMAARKYNIQAATYMTGIEQAKPLVKAGAVFGDAPPQEWLDAFASSPEHAFIFLFMQTGKVPNIRVRRFLRRDKNRGEMMAWQSGYRMFRHGVELYRDCMERFGPDVPWHDFGPMTDFTDEELPIWIHD